MKVKVEYQVSKETLRSEMIATGEKRSVVRSKEFELSEFPVEQRELILNASRDGVAMIDLRSARIATDNPVYGSDATRPDNYLTNRVDIFLPDNPSALDVYQALFELNSTEERERSFAVSLANEARAKRDAEYQRKLKVFFAVWDILAPDGKNMTDDEGVLKSVNILAEMDGFTPNKEDRSKPVHDTPLYFRHQPVTKDKLASIQKRRIEEERSRWIAEHGSRRLKMSIEKGYDCQRAYVTERAAIEAPGYTVDFMDECHWKERYSPTEYALDELQSAEALNIGSAIIVWLEKFVYDPSSDDFFEEPCEAIAIRGYLGKYDLVKPM